MDKSFVIARARLAKGLTQAELASMARTSQATLSAYERGVKSPSLKVLWRILWVMGFDLTLRKHIDWTEHHPPGIVAFWAPSELWAVEPPTCFTTLQMPDEINNTGMRTWNLLDRDERKGAYENLIRRGLPGQMHTWIDGGLLVEIWDELDLPEPVRDAWRPAIEAATRRIEVYGLSHKSAPEYARIRDYEPLPPPSPPPPRRSRFDPRPPPRL